MKKLLFIILLSIQVICSHANNIQVTNVVLQPATSTVQFTVSWDNGWRSSILNNWDAAYVFMKYKDIDGRWKVLNFTNVGDVVPAGFSSTFNAFTGTFLYRNSVGSGTTTITNVRLGANASFVSGIYDIKIFAIEMVYIPQAEYFLGDAFSGNAFSGNRMTANIPIGSGSTYSPLYNVIDPLLFVYSPPPLSLNSITTTFAGISFPAGYYPYYIMKYELSQGGYRDFLNTLTYNQQINHTLNPPSSSIGSGALVATPGTNRNYLEVKTSGTASTLPAVYGCDANNNNVYDEPSDGEWVACNFVNWPDMAAYLQWAGLRPITEMEYEKAARGIQLPVAGEYAWGNTNITTPIFALANPSQNSETISNLSTSFGNANYSSTYPNSPLSGPIRNGIFATATSNRVTSGGSFYGVMEMSGNLFERVVSPVPIPTDGGGGIGFIVYTNNAPTFASELNLIGYYNSNPTISVNWPGENQTGAYNSSRIIDGTSPAYGLIDRGGSFLSPVQELSISYRTFSQFYTSSGIVRDAVHGIRGGKSAPL